jgi:hypothetical protein
VITDGSRLALRQRAWAANGRHGALVAADGTIDWWAPGGMDQPPAFFRLLDPAGGALRLGPAHDALTRDQARLHPPPSHQQVVDGAPVVRTVLAAPGGGLIEVMDVLPIAGDRLVRLVTVLRGPGPVEVEVELAPGVAWGPARRVETFGEGAVWWRGGPLVDGLILRSGHPFVAVDAGDGTARWSSVTRLAPGEQLVVTVDELHADAGPLSPEGAQDLVVDTLAHWRAWSAWTTWDAPYGAAARRALTLLKSLTGPSGAPLAAGTTSLPRAVGGQRQDDSRLVAVADVAASVKVWEAAGYPHESEAAAAWVRHALESAAFPLPSWWQSDGAVAPVLAELTAPGWRRSEPVRLGARPDEPVAGDYDLGLLAAVVEAVPAPPAWSPGVASGRAAAAAGANALAGAWPALRGWADWASEHWLQPDTGVWGRPPAGPARLLLASRSELWWALDRLSRLARVANPLDLDAVAWQAAALPLRQWLDQQGDLMGGTLRRRPGPSQETDAALLRLAWRGPWPVQHPLVERTVDRVLEELSDGPWVLRHSATVDDGRGGADSVDVVATAWAAQALASQERWDEAHERLSPLAGLLEAGPGLLSEAFDPLSVDLRGNLPCAGALLAFLQAAAALAGAPR